MSDYHTTSRYLLQALAEIGVEYLFCNFGTDHAPLIEEIAKMQADAIPFPKVFLCPHENTAMHMAGGYALVTGRGQGVMVHVDVGTANAAMGMHNLFRTRIPVLLMAGKAPYTSLGELPGTRDDYVHFVQEPLDQGSIVRQYAKWEYTLPSGLVVKEVVRRAHTLMQSDPRGPVHLMFARETLAEEWPADSIHEFPERTHGPQRTGGIDPDYSHALAEQLLAAACPILITGYGGRSSVTSAAIERLSRLTGMRVFEHAPVINIGREFAGFGGFNVTRFLPRADFGLMVDTDVPWIPRDTQPHPDAFWTHIDIDTVKTAIPMWSFPAQERLQCDSGTVLEQLANAVEELSTPEHKAAAASRWEEMEAEFEDMKSKAAKLAANPGTVDAINVEYFAAELGRRLDPADTILSEAVTNNPVFARQIPRPLAGTMIRHSGSGLGAAGGLALGVKLAKPKHRAVHIVGDGGFYFGNLDSVFALSQAHDLPIFSIIVDNAGWNAVKDATLRVYPDGAARAGDAFQSRLPAGMEFSRLAGVSGAYGERLTDPAQVGAAIERCLAAVDKGRSALLHVRVTPI